MAFCVGLFAAFGVPSIPLPVAWFNRIATVTRLSPIEFSWFDGIARPALGLVLLFLVVRVIERQPFASIGIRRPSRADLASVVVVLALVLPITAIGDLVTQVLGVREIAAHASAAGKAEAALDPMWYQVPSIVLYALVEEVASRAYVIERIVELTGSLGLACAVNLTLDLLAHVPAWGFSYLYAVAPLECLFIALYIWRRNTLTSAAAHILVDAWAFWL
jgi:hypothetical protein